MRRDERILDLSFIEQSQRQFAIPLSYTPPYVDGANPLHAGRHSNFSPYSPRTPTRFSHQWNGSVDVVAKLPRGHRPLPRPLGLGSRPLSSRRISSTREANPVVLSLSSSLPRPPHSTPFRLFLQLCVCVRLRESNACAVDTKQRRTRDRGGFCILLSRFDF